MATDYYKDVTEQKIEINFTETTIEISKKEEPSKTETPIRHEDIDQITELTQLICILVKSSRLLIIPKQIKEIESVKQDLFKIIENHKIPYKQDLKWKAWKY